ncbi:transposase [Chryseobacterium soli]|uniref:Transposase n=1 Tax=Chryseobacterium soli TaxID=445961 RepID=A0A086A3J5_9FLAO|nr:transposase [Chryseobacterium soli]KFF11259.1 transposase [Chryseobacterium soli]
MSLYKDIHIGNLINLRVAETNIEIARVCNFFNLSAEEIECMYTQQSLDAEIILRWSKLLEYDFFRLYSQHLILYSPPASLNRTEISGEKYSLPVFKKNIYTKEIIDFLVELVESGDKSIKQVIEDYKIPKTTLHKWISKYKKKN